MSPKTKELEGFRDALNPRVSTYHAALWQSVLEQREIQSRLDQMISLLSDLVSAIEKKAGAR